ncbi:hypothetical protein ACFL3Y_01385 [Pseudomonadota bacterium]
MKAYISMIIVTLISVFAMSSYAEPAIVFEGEECIVALLPTPDAIPLVVIGDKYQAVAANAGRGDNPLVPGKLTCQGSHTVPLEHAVVQRQPCFVAVSPLGPLFTEDGRIVITPSGNWSALCKFRNAKED